MKTSDNETVLRWQFFSRSQSDIGRLLIRALVKKSLRRQSDIGLTQLKTILEQQA